MMKRLDHVYPEKPERSVLVGSWELINGREMEFGIAFYQRLLRSEPLVGSFFKYDVEYHAHLLVQGLTGLIAGLNDPASLRKTLSCLGARHQAIGVQPEHYESVCEYLLRTLSEFHGVTWDQKTEHAWVKFMRWVCDVMINAQ